jgi:hypothetical protein
VTMCVVSALIVISDRKQGAADVGAVSIRVEKQLWRQTYPEQRSVVYNPPSVRRQAGVWAFVI